MVIGLCSLINYYDSLQVLESQTDECATPQNGMKNAATNGDATSADTWSQEKRKADAVDKPVMTIHEENRATKKTRIELLKEIKLEKP